MTAVKKDICTFKRMETTDQLGRVIGINFPPRRIISLVPSQSELLWDLGLKGKLAGITKFCIHPEEMYRSVARVGGTKDINFAAIEKLKPDLIIANKEENEREQIERLSEKFPVWISDIYNLEDALTMMKEVGKITDKSSEAARIITEVRASFQSFKEDQHARLHRLPKVAYLIWKNPYMAAGRNTFIDYMLSECGLLNVFTNENSRYPEISTQMLIEKKPDFIFLSSEPYPFKEKHIFELAEYLPDSKVRLVDGEMFSWYGSRLRQAFPYLSDLLQKLEAAYL